MQARYIIAAGLALLPTLARAEDNVSYTYDAKGRLIRVEHGEGRLQGLTSSFTYDAADNRTASAVAGARGRLVVVPLGTLRLIPSR